MKENTLKDGLWACLKIFEFIGIETVSKSLETFIEEPSLLNLTKLYESIETFENNQDDRKKRMFAFGDGNQTLLMKCFIISIRKEYDDNGAAELIINEMPEDVTLKDNPYKNLHIIYEDENMRNNDFDRLKLILR